LVPVLSGARARAIASRIPLVGAIAPRIIDAVRDYRSNKRMLAAAASISIVGVMFYISSYYLIARGLPVHEPSWTEHLVVVASTACRPRSAPARWRWRNRMRWSTPCSATMRPRWRV